MKKHSIAILSGLLLLLIVAFIWGNSCLSSEASSAQSGAVMRFLKPLLDPKGTVSEADFHLWVRKAAHFIEFAALGCLIGSFFASLERLHQKRYLSLQVLIALLVATLDEYIQLHTERGSMVSDVLLDFCGALTGLGLRVLLTFCLKRMKAHSPAGRQRNS